MSSPYIAEQRKSNNHLWLSRLFKARETSILLIIVLLFIIIPFLSPHFLTKSNLVTTLIGLSLDAITAVGMTVALVSGGFDLSVGSMLAFSSIVSAYLFINGINIWVAVLAALILSGILGLITGFFISKVEINPLIMTLGMMGVIRGIAYIITEGRPISISGVNDSFSFIGEGLIFGIPVIIWILIAVVAIGDFLMRKSAVLRYVYYVGSNEKAGRLSGINVNKVKMLVYVITGVLAGIAGILALARFNVATPTAGNMVELRAIAACVIGGASLKGGEGTIFGALLGVILVGLVNNCLILLNVSIYWQGLVNGIVLIMAVALDGYAQKRKNRT